MYCTSIFIRATCNLLNFFHPWTPFQDFQLLVLQHKLYFSLTHLLLLLCGLLYFTVPLFYRSLLRAFTFSRLYSLFLVSLSYSCLVNLNQNSSPKPHNSHGACDLCVLYSSQLFRLFFKKLSLTYHLPSLLPENMASSCLSILGTGQSWRTSHLLVRKVQVPSAHRYTSYTSFAQGIIQNLGNHRRAQVGGTSIDYLVQSFMGKGV